jgi:hypothetical protein
MNHNNSNREGDGEKRTAQKARSTLGAESMHGTPRGALPATLGVSIGRIGSQCTSFRQIEAYTIGLPQLLTR